MNSKEFALNPEDFLKHSDWIRNLALSLVRDENEAADLVQETWVKASRGSSQPIENIRAWLGGIVRHLALQSWRSRSRRESREYKAADQEALPSASELTERAALQRHIEDLVLALEEPYRSTVLLRFFEGLPPREIAKRQNLPAATVSVRLTRGLAQLREKLDREYGNREAWCMVLIPLTKGISTTSAVKTTKLFSKTVLSVSVAAALVLIAVWVLPISFFKNSSPKSSKEMAKAQTAAEKQETELSAQIPQNGLQNRPESNAIASSADGGQGGATDVSRTSTASSGLSTIVPTFPEVSGFVKDAKGIPIQDMELVMCDSENHQDIFSPEAKRVKTDSQGRYSFQNLDWKKMQLLLVYPKHYILAKVEIKGKAVHQYDLSNKENIFSIGIPFEPGQENNIVFQAPAKLRVKLQNEKGIGLANRLIRLDYNEMAQCGKTDEEGRLYFSTVKPGKHILYLCRDSCKEPDEFALFTRWIELTAGEEKEITWEWNRDVARVVHGRLLKNGKPYTGADLDPGVAFLLPGTQEAPLAVEADRETGQFEVELRETGLYAVAIIPERGKNAHLRFLVRDLTPHTTRSIDLEIPNGQIAGRIFDAETNLPLKVCSVLIYPDLKGLKQILGDIPQDKIFVPLNLQQGEFSLEGFEDGKYKVWVKASGYPDQEFDATVAGGSAYPLNLQLKKPAPQK